MIVLVLIVVFAPVWLLCVVISVVLSFTRFRHLSDVFIMAPTLGFIAAEILSIGTMMFIGDVLGIQGPAPTNQNILIWGYMAGFAVGGVSGIAGGIALWRKRERKTKQNEKSPAR